MDGWLAAFLLSFGVVFVAELGDKSQLMALAFAGRFRAAPVLVGITLATSVVHAVSVAVGHRLGLAVPTGWVALGAGLAFLGFAAWTVRGDSLSDSDLTRAARGAGSVVLTVTVAFFLAELGDKTMLATVTLAAQHSWFGIWLGSTMGMVVADALAILAGRALARRLPERTVRYAAAGSFVLFGGWLLAGSAAWLTGDAPWATLTAGLDHHVAGWIALGLGLAAMLVLRFAAARSSESDAAHRAGPAGRWARMLFLTAVAVGLLTPLLVVADVLQPIPLLEDPGIVVVGAGMVLLGVSVLLLARRELDAARRARTGPGQRTPLVTDGVHRWVRQPGATGMVLAMAGTLLMVPTMLAVLACVLLVVAVQIEVRRVREPGLVGARGAEYTAYAERTGRFLPRIGSGAR